ncbi:hypothetical protein CDEST_15382 [Colletotrichum destructivum]|uniref:Uncharacterized protein n=1 Tax=Colletotrichum destructivum TaxID=34406 RepID=A0AAX4J4S5_9PEZI|nr:hypothetical protein CDEST_15382 [Colletotrichum destructivum]
MDREGAFETLVNVACSDSQMSGSQDQPRGTPSGNQSPQDRFNHPNDYAPTQLSDLNPQQMHPDGSQDERDSSFYCDGYKENTAPETPYQIEVFVDGYQMSFKGSIDCTGRPVDSTLTLSTRTKLLSVKLCITADPFRSYSKPRSARHHGRPKWPLHPREPNAMPS